MSPESDPAREPRPDEEEDFNRACRFLYSLVAAVQRYGVSSSVMQSELAQVARALHLRGQFLATPTQVQSILWKHDEDSQRLHVSVSNSGDYDLSRLAQVHELEAKVKTGDVGPEAGLDRLRAIADADSEYAPWLSAGAFALCGCGFGIILGLSWLDVFLAGALSVVSFGVAGLVVRWQGLTIGLELFVAAVATLLGSLLALVFPGSYTIGLAICAVIYFVPGFGLTLGASELMAGNTTSGLIGFTRAIVTSGKLFLGGLAGIGIAHFWATGQAPDVGSGVPHAWTWLGAPALVLGLAVLFRVRRRELVWPVLGALLVWSGVEAGAGLGFWQGTAIGAFLLTLASRDFAVRTGLPVEIIMLPAVMVLVPGVAALRALYAAQTEGIVQGLVESVQVLGLIAAILSGLLLGEVVLSIRQFAVSTVTTRRSETAA